MNILSLYWGICSSASLYKNGFVVAAAHEERFTRIKNDDAFPENAIAYCLREGDVKPQQLDGVAIASYEQGFDFTILREARWSVDDYLEEQRKYWYPKFYENADLEKVRILEDKIDLSAYPSDYWHKNYMLPDRNEKFLTDREVLVAEYLGIERKKAKRIEHHRCHAVYAYLASRFRGEKVLAFTIDAYGDGLNATIGIFDEKGGYNRVYESGICNIGRIYRYMTLLLGMKPNEHEYKVMGLAPYGREKYAQRALDVFKSTLYLDGIEFKWSVKPTDSYFWFRDRLEGIRFDNIAYALQIWVEDLLVKWVGNAVKKYGLHKIVVSGGVAMNIKAMGKIAQLADVEDMFIGGSGSDESMAISSGLCLAQDLSTSKGDDWDSTELFPIQHLYLGPVPDQNEIEEVVRSIDRERYDVKADVTAHDIAAMLVDGKILARCAGRMEFGQRALGNRSILADPVDLKVKERINSAIKNRDFWMPFAPVIMDEFVNKYLINPKNIKSPHMTIGFETTPKGYDAMIAACHPADRSARPQILCRTDNVGLYDILEEFEKLTGRGALLNTSFNLHGYPIVNTPKDAMHVFENSSLDVLVLEDTMILKKRIDD